MQQHRPQPLLVRWLPDAAARQADLVYNPGWLYGFSAGGGP